MTRESPNAAADLALVAQRGENGEDEMGRTDCPNGCVTDPDGECAHGWEAAAITLGII